MCTVPSCGTEGQQSQKKLCLELQRAAWLLVGTLSLGLLKFQKTMLEEGDVFLMWWFHITSLSATCYDNLHSLSLWNRMPWRVNSDDSIWWDLAFKCSSKGLNLQNDLETSNLETCFLSVLCSEMFLHQKSSLAQLIRINFLWIVVPSWRPLVHSLGM